LGSNTLVDPCRSNIGGPDPLGDPCGVEAYAILFIKQKTEIILSAKSVFLLIIGCVESDKAIIQNETLLVYLLSIIFQFIVFDKVR